MTTERDLRSRTKLEPKHEQLPPNINMKHFPTELLVKKRTVGTYKPAPVYFNAKPHPTVNTMTRYTKSKAQKKQIPIRFSPSCPFKSPTLISSHNVPHPPFLLRNFEFRRLPHPNIPFLPRETSESHLIGVWKAVLRNKVRSHLKSWTSVYSTVPLRLDWSVESEFLFYKKQGWKYQCKYDWSHLSVKLKKRKLGDFVKEAVKRQNMLEKQE